MKFMPLASSLLVLGLFAGPSLAATSPVPGTMVVAQAEVPADKLEAIKKFVSNKRPVAKLPDERIAQRIQRANAFLKTQGLPADVQQALQSELAELQAEQQKRQAGGGAAAQGSGEQPAAPAATADNGDEPMDEPAASNGSSAGQQQQQTQQQAQAAPASSADIDAVLNDATPLSSLSPKELRQKFRNAIQLSKGSNVSKEQRKALRDVARAARAELDKRKGGTAPAASTTNQQPAGQTGTGTGNQTSQGTQAGTTAGQQPAATANTPADPAAEAKAKGFLTDGVDASKLSNQDLRKRLLAMRDTLQAGKLSKETNRELRKKLAAEREILRSRVNQTNNTTQTGGTQTGGSTTVTGNNNNVTNTTVNTTVINNTTVNYYLKDKRPSKDLKQEELRLRIRILRDAYNDKKYAEAERVYWRDVLLRDRQLLNQQLLEERRRRQAELNVGIASKKEKFDLSLDFKPDRRPPPYVFAAEANDDDLEDILAAPPRREIKRRYSVEEVESNPDLRDSVARIEIDTVRFGFGEGFLREEEIENLDRIAQIMEEILAVSPGEVFMVEGHTDAVGSDAANLQLSRERSQAVKKALVEYFVIPAENLKTVGYGERYLKIPTEEAEAENRRVSIARITPLVGAIKR